MKHARQPTRRGVCVRQTLGRHHLRSFPRGSVCQRHPRDALPGQDGRFNWCVCPLSGVGRRERERVCVRERKCVCVRERECVCVCVRERAPDDEDDDDERDHHGRDDDADLLQGSWFRVQGPGFRVQGSGCRVQGSGFRVWGSRSRFGGGALRRVSTLVRPGSPGEACLSDQPLQVERGGSLCRPSLESIRTEKV